MERVGELDTLYKFPTTTIMSITVTPDHAKREGGNGSNQAPFSSKHEAEGWTHPRDTLLH